MAGPAMTADEVAEELGRSRAWLYEHWRGLVAKGRLPPPLHEEPAGLVWSRAQVYAALDADLPEPVRVAAQAYRAAAAAAAREAHAGEAVEQVEEWRVRLNRRYTGGGK